MNENHVLKISTTHNIPVVRVAAAAKLLEEGATVPFIARYRKEQTGSLDEVQIALVRDELERLASIDARKKSIKDSMTASNQLTPELEAKLDAAESLATLEDIYQPFKPKRRTRATIAKEKGLEPLALFIFENQDAPLGAKPSEFISEEKGVKDADEAVAGARDIIAEIINDDAEARGAMRKLFEDSSVLSSKVMFGKEAEGAKYRDYFDWSEPAKTAPSHRILAVRRGEAEGFLIMRVTPEEALGIQKLRAMFVKGKGECAAQVALAAEDCYKRLLANSTETHIRLEIKKRADEEAVKIFASNLRELLMSAPLGGKNVLAIDPGFRTGCKVVCLNRQGDLLHHDVIYPEQSELRLKDAKNTVLALCARFGIEAIAIGNGTAGRETEKFIKALDLPKSIAVVMVNESGASIYSASEVAREEFPDQDITVRGSVSIGRRLMDPLAELVKIDPQSIGVGQYQHDVSQTLLKRTLDDVVISCVNSVGVEVNTASKQLLSYVSGLNASIAANIVNHRMAAGPFKTRKDLLKVKGLGDKTFEQAAGFLRVKGAENPLDESAVHPERYRLVEKMASDLGADIKSIMKEPALRSKINLKNYISAEVGLPTLQDILQELGKPGRDPREKFEAFSFMDGVNTIDDLQEGMRLPGIVTNVTAFGAFVDIGVHQDGLVHISEISDTFVKDASEAVKPGQKVNVWVLEVDKARKRIALSMKSNPQKRALSAGEAAQKGARPAQKTFGGKPQGAGDRRGGFSSGGNFGNDWTSQLDKFGR